MTNTIEAVLPAETIKDTDLTDHAQNRINPLLKREDLRRTKNPAVIYFADEEGNYLSSESSRPTRGTRLKKLGVSPIPSITEAAIRVFEGNLDRDTQSSHANSLATALLTARELNVPKREIKKAFRIGQKIGQRRLNQKRLELENSANPDLKSE